MKETARNHPEYFKKSVMYQLFLRTFTQEGTLKSAEKLLPHLREIGVTIVYLCPVAEADDDERTEFWSERQKASGLNNPKNPYRMKDYFSIDSEYGTEKDLHNFVDTAHRLGLKVILDLVYYHCGIKAIFLAEHPDFVKPLKNGEIDCGEWHFPRLNFASSELREYLWSNMVYFIKEFDVDGYRCDVGDMVPLDFWEEGRNRIETIKPNCIMLNEGGSAAALRTAFDVNYHFQWSDCIVEVMREKIPASKLKDVWEERNNSVPTGGLSLRCFDNHDIANDEGDNRSETGVGTRAVEVALVLNFAIDGIPFLYNGCEIADTAKHSIFTDRNHGRLSIDWSNALTEPGKERMKLIQTLTQLRKTLPAMSEGETVFFSNNCEDAVLTFKRESINQTLFIAVNFAKEAQKVNVEIDISKAKTVFSNGAEIREYLTLAPFGYLIAEL